MVVEPQKLQLPTFVQIKWPWCTLWFGSFTDSLHLPPPGGGRCSTFFRSLDRAIFYLWALSFSLLMAGGTSQLAAAWQQQAHGHLFSLLWCISCNFKPSHALKQVTNAMVNGKVEKNVKIWPQVKVIVGRHDVPRKFWLPYSQDFRLSALLRHASGTEDATVQLLWSLFQYPSKWTIHCYRLCIIRNGTYYEYCHTGNIRAHVLRGSDLVLLAVYVQCFPHATGLEKIAFLYRATGMWHNEGQITKAEQRIGLSRKKSSTLAVQASEPRYVFQWQIFWHLPYPFGIADISCEEMIDINEAKIILQTANRKFGKCTMHRQCRKTGLYGHGKGWILILALLADGWKWYKFVENSGTDVTLFVSLIKEILTDLGPWVPGQKRYCFTLDNLNVHRHAQVINSILLAGYRIVFRVFYLSSLDGAIELVFNTYEGKLKKRNFKIHNDANLVHEMQSIIHSLGALQPYFHKIGYR